MFSLFPNPNGEIMDISGWPKSRIGGFYKLV